MSEICAKCKTPKAEICNRCGQPEPSPWHHENNRSGVKFEPSGKFVCINCVCYYMQKIARNLVSEAVSLAEPQKAGR